MNEVNNYFGVFTFDKYEEDYNLNINEYIGNQIWNEEFLNHFEEDVLKLDSGIYYFDVSISYFHINNSNGCEYDSEPYKFEVRKLSNKVSIYEALTKGL